MAVLAEYHRALGDLVFEYEGTLEHFAGDGLLVFFNDPVPDPGRAGPRRADGGRMREAVSALAAGLAAARLRARASVSASRAGSRPWGGSGSRGATTTRAIGTVTNLAARLSAQANAGQILVSQRVMAGAGDVAVAREVGPLELRGFSKPMVAYEIVGLSDEVRA